MVADMGHSRSRLCNKISGDEAVSRTAIYHMQLQYTHATYEKDLSTDNLTVRAMGIAWSQPMDSRVNRGTPPPKKKKKKQQQKTQP